MFGIPSPWLILGGVLAFLGVAVGGFFYGGHIENLKWTAKEQKAIAENIQHARDIENAANLRNAAIEKAYLDEQAKSSDLAERLTAAMSGGVRLPGACKQSVPPTPTGSSSADAAAPGDGVLPEEIGRNLVDLAREAERVLAVARAGEAYAVAVPK